MILFIIALVRRKRQVFSQNVAFSAAYCAAFYAVSGTATSAFLSSNREKEVS
jgi:hypothetical protein